MRPVGGRDNMRYAAPVCSVRLRGYPLDRPTDGRCKSPNPRIVEPDERLLDQVNSWRVVGWVVVGASALPRGGAP